MGPSTEGYKRLRQIVVLHVRTAYRTWRAYYHPFRAAIGQINTALHLWISIEYKRKPVIRQLFLPGQLETR